jgi:hypothetical protein
MKHKDRRRTRKTIDKQLAKRGSRAHPEKGRQMTAVCETIVPTQKNHNLSCLFVALHSKQAKRTLPEAKSVCRSREYTMPTMDPSTFRASLVCPGSATNKNVRHKFFEPGLSIRKQLERGGGARWRRDAAERGHGAQRCGTSRWP